MNPPTLLGTYQTPRFSYGDVVECARRGEVRIVGLSSAPTPWPIGQTLPKGRGRSLVLYDDLAEAVRRESVELICYWFGVKDTTVWLWRKALGVGAMTPGTTALKSKRLAPALVKVCEAALPTLCSPERREKIAASRRGKPRPRHVIEAMRQGRTGKPHDERTRLRMSGVHKARGTRPPLAGIPWTKEEDELARTLKARKVVERTGRTLSAVYSRRRILGLPDGRSGR